MRVQGYAGEACEKCEYGWVASGNQCVPAGGRLACCVLATHLVQGLCSHGRQHVADSAPCAPASTDVQMAVTALGHTFEGQLKVASISGLGLGLPAPITANTTTALSKDDPVNLIYLNFYSRVSCCARQRVQGLHPSILR